MTQSGRKTMIGLIFVAMALVGLIVFPFAQAVFLACAFAGALHPLCDRLTRRLRNRRQVAAALLTALVVLAVVLPIAAITAMVISELLEGTRFVRDTLQGGGTQALIEKLPVGLQQMASHVVSFFAKGEMKLQQFTQQGGSAAAAVGTALRFTGEALLQTIMMLIALFFLLVDGAKLVDWVGEISPLKRRQVRELLAEFRKVSVSVILSVIITAAVQAAAALLGFLILRVPRPFFFTLVTFFFAFIPVIGAGTIVVAVAALLFVTGHPVAALILALWGLIVVGLVDNLVKPLLIRGDIEMHGGVVFFALLGGLAVFGLVGLVAGPLIVAFFLALVRMYQRDYKTPSTTTS